MSKRLRILHATRDGSVPVLTIELDGKKAVLHQLPEDPDASAFIESLVGEGVNQIVANPNEPNGFEARYVTPADGAAYSDAVEDMLGRTSRWIVVPE